MATRPASSSSPPAPTEGAQAAPVNVGSAGCATESLTELELDAWRGLLLVHATLVKELDRELQDAEGLSLKDYDVLVQLADAPHRRLRMGCLAESVVLSPSGLTRLIDDLVGRGLIRREPSTGDGRGMDAVLTREGLSKRRRAHRTHIAGVRRRFHDCLGEGDLRALAHIWRSLDRGPSPSEKAPDCP